jgi:hypothetical protein
MFLELLTNGDGILQQNTFLANLRMITPEIGVAFSGLENLHGCEMKTRASVSLGIALLLISMISVNKDKANRISQSVRQMPEVCTARILHSRHGEESFSSPQHPDHRWGLSSL